MGLSEGQTDGQREERLGEAGEGPGAARDGLEQREGGRACYLPTWGCRCLRLSVGVGMASMRVTGWLRA